METTNISLDSRFLPAPYYAFLGKYADLPDVAKVVLTLLSDRRTLSLRNGWKIDKDYFIIYTYESLMEHTKHARATIAKALKILEERKLITRIRVGLGKPNKIILHIPEDPENFVKPKMTRTIHSTAITHTDKNNCKKGPYRNSSPQTYSRSPVPTNSRTQVNTPVNVLSGSIPVQDTMAKSGKQNILSSSPSIKEKLKQEFEEKLDYYIKKHVTDTNVVKADDLTSEERQELNSKYGKTAVDEQIEKILKNNYRNCLNYATINQWCAEAAARSQKKSKNRFTSNMNNRNYDFDDLERKLLLQ